MVQRVLRSGFEVTQALFQDSYIQ